MSTRDDGGAVFPTLVVLGDRAVSQGGLPLRDHFAGEALIGLLSGRPAGAELPSATWAKAAYKLADAMLAERVKDVEQKGGTA